MACGIPVVTSRCAGAAEIITDGVDGMLLDDPQSIHEIAEKARQTLGRLGVMGQRARQTALKYSWEKVASQTLEVYRKALE